MLFYPEARNFLHAMSKNSFCAVSVLSHICRATCERILDEYRHNSEKLKQLQERIRNRKRKENVALIKTKEVPYSSFTISFCKVFISVRKLTQERLYFHLKLRKSLRFKNDENLYFVMIA
jgi:hypothetical protein